VSNGVDRSIVSLKGVNKRAKFSRMKQFFFEEKKANHKYLFFEIPSKL